MHYNIYKTARGKNVSVCRFIVYTTIVHKFLSVVQDVISVWNILYLETNFETFFLRFTWSWSNMSLYSCFSTKFDAVGCSTIFSIPAIWANFIDFDRVHIGLRFFLETRRWGSIVLIPEIHRMYFIVFFLIDVYLLFWFQESGASLLLLYFCYKVLIQLVSSSILVHPRTVRVKSI